MSDKQASTRRDVLKKGAVAGGVVWIAPSVISVTSAAAASGCTTPFSLSQNFNGLPAESPPAFVGYLPYGPNAALVGGWFTTAGTTTIDAVVYQGPFGNQGFTNTAPSPPVIIDLAGTPGPGGITTTVEIPCAGDYTITFERFQSSGVADDTSLTVSGQNVIPTSTSWGPSGLQSDSLTFTTTADNASVTITFATVQTGNGNTMVTNISIS
jgi:hypothetical protein